MSVTLSLVEYLVFLFLLFVSFVVMFCAGFGVMEVTVLYSLSTVDFKFTE